ncbi:hotdog fold domain-containing protein [Actinomycetospora cinnamomea]|uniref:Acyl-coenzyme A thioesterase PaaI-like protein n=1 Tax=Actinomycetospora cinnamomea TaxID=663609 RepID=A0A2U1F6D6_9PSEU|nr:hotdog fold domain-containing protein [Actinomycetospora cinnamomea]PVZ07745.1 acyl-coenzyme A thioesterase PaaI-like protein [Actinomycetospora cinnamomea]
MSTPSVLGTWRRFSGSWPGRLLVSAAVWLRAPYFLTAAPVIRRLEPGRSEVSLRNWWLVHNHLGTVHAIASCNLAEYAMGVLAEATVPSTHRWIPRGMSVQYLAKAETDLHAVATFPTPPAFADEREDVDADVVITDAQGREVVRATITLRISPRPARASVAA